MKKIIFALYILLLAPVAGAEFFIVPNPPSITADSFVVIDYNSKKIIASKNEHKQRAPASLTKLMTSYVVLQRISSGFAKLTDEVTISEKAWKTGGSRSFIKVGTKVKLETLLKGMIIQSGNDASVALAEHIAGTEMTFVALMNKYAHSLGMQNTNFENSSGLPAEGQLSTSYDISLLASAIIREFPEYYKWYGEKYFTHNNIKQPNRNKLLWSDKSVDGLKTGHTKAAGYCLAASAERLGMRLISVVLGSDSTKSREAQTRQLLDYGFRFFETNKLSIEKQEIAVFKGAKSTVLVGLDQSKYITLERRKFDKLTKKLTINDTIVAPISTGDVVGELTLTFKDEVVEKLPLVALEDVESGSFVSRMIDSIKLLF